MLLCITRNKGYDGAVNDGAKFILHALFEDNQLTS